MANARRRGFGLAALIALGVQFLRLPDANVSLPRSTAVLPFKPLVASESDERMQLGMTEALINQLSRIQTLRVEPLARVRRYSALEQDPLQAGRELGVDAVLEGHFQRSDGNLYVGTRLLRTADGTALATNDWKKPFSDIFEIQKGAAQSVASVLELTLTPPSAPASLNPTQPARRPISTTWSDVTCSRFASATRYLPPKGSSERRYASIKVTPPPMRHCH